MSAKFLRSNKTLCEACCGINYESLTAPGGYRHTLTWAELASGYAPDPDGCAMCWMAFSKITGRDPMDVGETPATGPIHLSIGKMRRAGRQGRASCLSFGNAENHPVDPGTIFIRTITGSPIADLASTTREALIDTSAKSSIQAASQWLKTCVQEHACASIPDIDPGHEEHVEARHDRYAGPKRLVDLMAFGESSFDARLIQAKPKDNVYVALSYCWGDIIASKYQTSTTTLSSQMTCIDHSAMPLTIRHAFEITRALKIRYIWIDALCIIQDSKSDWEVESSKMGSIYSRAFVTIAADYGNTAHSGCYNQIRTCALPPGDFDIEITSKLSGGQESSLYFTYILDTDLPEVEESKLSSRAWSCQERLLSTRIIHFTEKQLFWECRKEICPQDGIPRIYDDFHPLPSLVSRLQFHLRRKSVLEIWYNSVVGENYSKRDLTIAADKLPAISALARLWSQYTHSSYLAGIWEADIHLGLAWYRLPHQKGSRPLKYRCPSWSWAALNCEVSWGWVFPGGYPNKSRIKVLEAEVQLEGRNAFGGVTGAWLKVVGRVRSLNVQFRDASSRPILQTTDGSTLGDDVPVFMDIWNDVPPEVIGLLLSSNSGPNGHPAYLLLLGPSPSDPQKYVRKGLAEVWGPQGEKIYDEWEEQTLVLI